MKRKPSSRKPARKRRRAGPGRPRSRLPAAILEKLGEPPEHPEKLAIWNARVIAEVTWLLMRGEIGTELAAALRASAGAIGRASTRAQDAEWDDEDDDATGPKLEPVEAETGRFVHAPSRSS